MELSELLNAYNKRCLVPAIDAQCLLFINVIYGVMHIVRTQLRREGVSPNAYNYCLNCAFILFFCRQGGGVKKSPFICVRTMCMTPMCISHSMTPTYSNTTHVDLIPPPYYLS